MDLSRWLKRGGAVVLPVAIGLVAADPAPVRAQTAGEATTADEL